MPRLAWLILTVISFFFATFSLLDAIYWIITGSDVELGVGFIAGTFFLPLFLYYGAYWAWKKARAADKQTEKKG